MVTVDDIRRELALLRIEVKHYDDTFVACNACGTHVFFVACEDEIVSSWEYDPYDPSINYGRPAGTLVEVSTYNAFISDAQHVPRVVREISTHVNETAD